LSHVPDQCRAASVDGRLKPVCLEIGVSRGFVFRRITADEKIAVDPALTGHGLGHAIVDRLLEVARELQLQRLFVLTFETEFFGRHGFTEIEGTPVTAEVFEEMCRSYDIGVAEFLDLSYVKPNILGNSRMLLVL